MVAVGRAHATRRGRESAELWSSARESGPADGRGVLECGVLECGVPECPGGSSHWQGRG